MTARSSSVERAEPHDLVDAVDELGLEEVGRVARQVGGHDEHGVGEVDRAALAVGEAAVVEHLQQDVEHVGVGLLDLVEQHHRVGPAAHRLGELAALLVADVARAARRPGAETVCFSMYSLMSMRTMARSSSKRNSASARASSVLPTPVGPEEEERADGPVGVRQAGPAAPDGVGHRRDRLVLADDPRRAGASSMRTSFSTSPSISRVTGTPVQRLTTSATSSASTSSFKKRWLAWSSASACGGLLDPALEVGQLAVADRRGPGQVALALEALGVAAALLELAP